MCRMRDLLRENVRDARNNFYDDMLVMRFRMYSSTKCNIVCNISNCENCSDLCKRCVPKGNFLNGLGPRTYAYAKCKMHGACRSRSYLGTCENSECENPKGVNNLKTK
jgi:hypothetical protein